MTLEQIDKLRDLKAKHPEREVIFVVDSDVIRVNDEDSCYAQGWVEDIKLGIYTIYEDLFYTTIEDLEETILSNIDTLSFDQKIRDQQVQKIIKMLKTEYKIIVSIGL